MIEHAPTQDPYCSPYSTTSPSVQTGGAAPEPSPGRFFLEVSAVVVMVGLLGGFLMLILEALLHSWGLR